MLHTGIVFKKWPDVRVWFPQNVWEWILNIRVRFRAGVITREEARRLIRESIDAANGSNWGLQWRPKDWMPEKPVTHVNFDEDPEYDA